MKIYFTAFALSLFGNHVVEVNGRTLQKRGGDKITDALLEVIDVVRNGLGAEEEDPADELKEGTLSDPPSSAPAIRGEDTDLGGTLESLITESTTTFPSPAPKRLNAPPSDVPSAVPSDMPSSIPI